MGRPLIRHIFRLHHRVTRGPAKTHAIHVAYARVEEQRAKNKVGNSRDSDKSQRLSHLWILEIKGRKFSHIGIKLRSLTTAQNDPDRDQYETAKEQAG